MITTIDKAGRVVIPAAVRSKAGLYPGAQLEVILDDFSVRLVRTGPGPKLVRKGKRWVAKPALSQKELPVIDIAGLVDEERNRWPL